MGWNVFPLPWSISIQVNKFGFFTLLSYVNSTEKKKKRHNVLCLYDSASTVKISPSTLG